MDKLNTNSADEVNPSPHVPEIVDELPANLQIVADRVGLAFAKEINNEFRKLVAFNWALEKALGKR